MSVLSSKFLCTGLIARTEFSPTECGVLSEWDRETSTARRNWPTAGCCAVG